MKAAASRGTASATQDHCQALLGALATPPPAVRTLAPLACHAPRHGCPSSQPQPAPQAAQDQLWRAPQVAAAGRRGRHRGAPRRPPHRRRHRGHAAARAALGGGGTPGRDSWRRRQRWRQRAQRGGGLPGAGREGCACTALVGWFRGGRWRLARKRPPVGHTAHLGSAHLRGPPMAAQRARPPAARVLGSMVQRGEPPAPPLGPPARLLLLLLNTRRQADDAERRRAGGAAPGQL